MNAGIGYNNTFICCCMHTRLFGACMYVHMMMVICLNTNAIEQLSLGKTEYIEYSMYVCMLYVCFSGKSASSWSTFCCELKLHWSSGYEKNVCRAVQHFIFSSKINRLNMNVYTKWIQCNWCCISVLSEPIQHNVEEEDDGGEEGEEKFNNRASTTKLLSRLFPLCIENVLKTIDNHIT